MAVDISGYRDYRVHDGIRVMISKVWVWQNRKHDYVQTDVRKLRCPECGTKYNPHSDTRMWIEYDLDDSMFLQCGCGNVFYTDLRDEDYE